MEFIDENLAQYCEAHTSPETDLLARLNRETHLKVLSPRMLSGHLQGRFLSMISHLMRPKRILEVGTYTGYSALCMAEGLAEDGELHTIDINEELEDFARKYFDQSPFGHKIVQHIGDAMEIIPTLDIQWDIVFLDADKFRYPQYFEMLVERIAPGGLLMADNVLWSGKIIDDRAQDKDTVALRQLNDMIQAHPAFENALIPIRDGVMMARKKA